MYIQSNLEKCIVESYNSRPREMINNVLEKFQTGDLKLSDSEIEMVLNRTYEVLKYFKGNNSNYYLDAVIKIYSQDQELGVEFLDRINDSQEIKDTFNQSPSTTTNVNKRLKFAVDIWKLEKGKMNV